MEDKTNEQRISELSERYEKFSPDIDTFEKVSMTEEFVKKLVTDAPVNSIDDFKEPVRKWAHENGVRLYLAHNIFDVLVDEEVKRRGLEDKYKEIFEEVARLEEEDEFIPLLNWSDVSKMKFPENPWRINKVLPLAGITFIAAASTGRKTWIAMEMSNAITTPRPFLHDAFFEVKGCNILYIDAEMGLPQLQRRGTQLGFDNERKYEIHTLNDDTALNFYKEECSDLERVIESIKRNDIGVVIIDTFRAVAGGLKEEKAEEVRMLFNRLKTLKDMGVSVVVLDHLRKKQQFEGKKPNMDQLFSSQDKAASSDMINMLRADDPSNTIMFYQVKNRYGQVLKPFRIQMTDTAPDEKHNRITLKFDEWEQEEEKLLEQAMEAVISLLENGSMKRKELLAATQKMKLGSEKTMRRACASLEETGLINKSKTGREVTYSLKTPEKEGSEDENVDNNLF